MSSRDNEYYIETYVAYPLKFTSNSNFTLVDVVDMTATLTHVRDECSQVIWTKSGGGIIDDGTNLIIEIQANQVLAPGRYNLRVTMVNSLGKTVGLDVFPNRLIFK